jgi:hypothetical protein
MQRLKIALCLLTVVGAWFGDKWTLERFIRVSPEVLDILSQTEGIAHVAESLQIGRRGSRLSRIEKANLSNKAAERLGFTPRRACAGKQVVDQLE